MIACAILAVVSQSDIVDRRPGTRARAAHRWARTTVYIVGAGAVGAVMVIAVADTANRPWYIVGLLSVVLTGICTLWVVGIISQREEDIALAERLRTRSVQLAKTHLNARRSPP